MGITTRTNRIGKMRLAVDYYLKEVSYAWKDQECTRLQLTVKMECGHEKPMPPRVYGGAKDAKGRYDDKFLCRECK